MRSTSGYTYMFQLTPPRGGDRYIRTSAPQREVSTHAPARGRPNFSKRLPISAVAFQLTPPRGGDRIQLPRRVRPQRVSTHAPARGRPVRAPRSRAGYRRFNSRPREGATAVCCCFRFTVPCFNSRPREGATPYHRLPAPPPPCFNSRPREGATRRRSRPMAAKSRFQLTPPRGGDPDGQVAGEPAVVSTHAPARGRPGYPPTDGVQDEFQLTPPRGGDSRRNWSRTQ